MNTALGITALTSATLVWVKLSKPIQEAARTTENAITGIRSNVVQLRAEIEKLPATLRASEQATRSASQAVRVTKSGIPIVLSQVESLGKTVSDLNPKIKETSVNLRTTAKGMDWYSFIDAVKGAKATLYTLSNSLDLVAPQFLDTGTVISKQARELRLPLDQSLGNIATALDYVAGQSASIRTGVIVALPGVLDSLANSLESYLQPLKMIPVVINATCILLFTFGLCFLAIGLKQCANLFVKLV